MSIINRRSFTPQEVAKKMRRDRERNVFDEIIKITPLAHKPLWPWWIGIAGCMAWVYSKVRKLS